MVQEDLAISPCGLYKSYFLLLILVVNVVKLQQKIYIYNHDTVASSEKWLTNRGIPSTTQTSQPPRSALVLQGVLHKLLFAETREGFSKTVGYIHDISYFASRGLPKSY